MLHIIHHPVLNSSTSFHRNSIPRVAFTFAMPSLSTLVGVIALATLSFNPASALPHLQKRAWFNDWPLGQASDVNDCVVGFLLFFISLSQLTLRSFATGSDAHGVDF
jgi:hypothetical protein